MPNQKISLPRTTLPILTVPSIRVTSSAPGLRIRAILPRHFQGSGAGSLYNCTSVKKKIMLMVPCFFNELLHVWVSCGLFRPKVGICFHTFYRFPTYFLHTFYIFLHTFYMLSTYFLPNLHSTYFLLLKKPFLKLKGRLQLHLRNPGQCRKISSVPVPKNFVCPWSS